jgi:hypothetical protein
MNIKQLSILIVLVILLGGAGLHLYQRNQASYVTGDVGSGQKILGDFPLNDVAQITIKQTNAELNIIKQDDLWKVKERYNYAANFNEIHELLRKMWELKSVQDVKVGPSQFGRLDLLPPDKGANSGTLIDFKDKAGKPIRGIMLGKKYSKDAGASPYGYSSEDGRFVSAKDASGADKVWLVSEPFRNIETKADAWLDKEFVKVEKLKSVSVTSTNATNDWKMFREIEGGEMKLADKKAGEELDSNKIWGVNNALSSANFNDVLPRM